MARVLIILSLLCLALPAAAEENVLTNIPPAAPGAMPGAIPGGTPAPLPEGFGPGAAILLPDGRQAIIEEILPDGQWRTNLGLITPPQGVVLVTPARPELKTSDPGQMLPAQPVPETSRTPAVVLEQPHAAQPEAATTPEKAQVREAPGTPEKRNEPHYYTLAELLPKTAVPEKKEETRPEKKEAKQQEKKEAKQPEKKEAKQQEKKEVKQPEKKERKEEKKPEKPKAGQELRIPENAAKTGSLDFLEGCWQGTRPEYYSKRTIKECFCFGAGGKTGKRRVFDYTQHRTCIGGSRAKLSADGVLTVISSGAACNDGERWGQAEMVCRNSGPRTPCSWVFRDAQNGRQSYEIPFVRVESCGR